LADRGKSDKVSASLNELTLGEEPMPTNQVYDTVIAKLRQLRPEERITRLRNLAWMMSGIFMSKSVHLNKIALKIPSKAVQLSVIQRLHRFLDNPAFQVRSWYKPVACQLVSYMHNTVGEVRLVMDATKIGFHYQWLTISIAFRRRAIPIAWTWLQGSKGHSSAKVQLALLRYVYTLLPQKASVLLVADTEFEDGDVQKQLNEWKWHYVLRQKPNNLVLFAEEWRPFRSLITKPSNCLWVENTLLTMKHKLTVNLLAYWKRGEEDPWLLATNLPSMPSALKAYQRRMWIEEMHGDLKANGFYFEDSHLQSFSRLSRLAFALSLLYLWLIVEGTKAIKNGERRLVDRNDRRDLSIFQIGLRLIERRLSLFLPISFSSFTSPDSKLSGS
jgi:hypothetical protein